ncbi:hypothetical protein F2P56_036092 [Juglans regia]|uniref:Uncharacterized protein n=2 Tax=Juglans regia TaxID=51240 RepID=A0A833WCD4_JUGRE|nr:uncharacterized protein LOC109015772 [Juglans regia]KAF5443543.1 hypothetical protein F2P56_036092 [Juglans regia]
MAFSQLSSPFSGLKSPGSNRIGFPPQAICYIGINLHLFDAIVSHCVPVRLQCMAILSKEILGSEIAYPMNCVAQCPAPNGESLDSGGVLFAMFYSRSIVRTIG